MIYNGPPGYIETPDQLTLKQQFRLVEIAHETHDAKIKELALMVLQQQLHPPRMVAATSAVEKQEPHQP